MDKKITISLLLDFYGQLLSEKQFAIMDYYYNDDLSLREISDIVGITRQGIHDTIKRSEQFLIELEGKIGLYGKWHSIHEKLEAVEKSIIDVQQNVNGECDRVYINQQCKNAVDIIEEIYKNF